jgi:hypothetical protein
LCEKILIFDIFI